MTTTLQTDSANDIFLDANGNIAIATGLQAVLQQCEEAVTTLRSELIYQTDRGVDYENTVFKGSPNVVAFNRQARRQILSVVGVIEISMFQSNVVGDTLEYRAEIVTTFGAGEIASGV